MNMKKIFLGLSVVAISLTNLFVGQGLPTEATDLAFENIEVVGLSASETTCDASNDNRCEIISVGVGTGKLIYIN